MDEAKKNIAASIKNDQSNAYSHFVKGLTEVESKDIPKACKCFNKAIDRAPLHKDRSYKEIEKALSVHCDSKKKI